MTKRELQSILSAVRGVRVCLVGDLCLDAYWRADMRLSRLSRETPHHPLPITEERYGLGGGGNVVANLATLGVKEALPLSVIGSDWRGYLLRQLLAAQGISDAKILTDPLRITPCYCKPLRAGISDVVYEDPRLDFENREPMREATEAAFLRILDAAAETADIFAVSDQLDFGVITPKVRDRLCEIAKRKPVVVDSRDRIGAYRNVILKPNELEAATAAGLSLGQPEAAAQKLAAQTGAPVIVTLGNDGAIWQEDDRTVRIPALNIAPPVDTVGAGDTFLAAFCAAYAAGTDGAAAVAFANRACAVTVKKIGMTGVAAPEELLQAAEEDV